MHNLTPLTEQALIEAEAEQGERLRIAPRLNASTVGRHISGYVVRVEDSTEYRCVVTLAYDVTNPAHFRTGGSEVDAALASIDELYLILEGGGEYKLIGIVDGKEIRSEPKGIRDLVHYAIDWAKARQDCAEHFERGE